MDRVKKANELITELEYEIESLELDKYKLEKQLEEIEDVIEVKKNEISNIQYDLENE